MLSAGPSGPHGTHRNQWAPAALEDLKHQLQKAGYEPSLVTLTSDTADLIGQLFGDVLKGAKYGKTARQLIEMRNQRITDLEQQLANKSVTEPAADGTTLERLEDEQKHRVYRLLYLANTAIELLNRNNSQQANLLTELIEKDKSGNLAPRGEIADYWKVISERDQLRAESADKDVIIADLLANGQKRNLHEISRGLFVSSRTILSAEEDLVKTIQALKSSVATAEISNTSSKPETVDSPVTEEVTKLTNEKKTLEAELKHVQKAFAQHLKQCEASMNENDHNNQDSMDLSRQRAKLQAALNERQEDCRMLNKRVHELEIELSQRQKTIDNLKQDEQHFREELAALVTRCDLFEDEFNHLEARRLEDDHKIKLLEQELAEFESLKKAHAEVEEALENAQLSFLNTDRALSDARDEIAALRIDLSKLNEVRDMMDGEIARLRKQNITANGALERLNQTMRELKNRCREREIEHTHLEQVIRLREKELEETCAAKEELQNAMKLAQDNEDAALLDKDEALRNQEQYRNALKDLKRRLDTQTAELAELKGRNRFLVTQLADRIEPNGPTQGPETVQRVQKELDDSETPQLVSELAGLRVENKLLREKLASNNLILQRAISARKEAQTIAASESMAAAKYKAALDDLSDRQLTCSYPPTGYSASNAASSRRQTNTAKFIDFNRRESLNGSMISESFMTSESVRESQHIPSMSYQTTSEDYTTSSGRFNLYRDLPTASVSATTSSGRNPSITQQSVTTGVSQNASIKTQIGSIGGFSASSVPLPSRTPPQTSSSDNSTYTAGDTKSRQTNLTRPTPVPKARSPTKGSTLSFTERAMARIHEIMNDFDEDSNDDENRRSVNEDETPRHSTRARPIKEGMNSYMGTLEDNIDGRRRPNLLPSSYGDELQMASTTGGEGDEISVRSPRHLIRPQRIFVNDQDLGHGGGYYWSPPQVHEDPPESVSLGSLTYTNPTTNRSLMTGGENTDRSRMLLDGWITERTMQ